MIRFLVRSLGLGDVYNRQVHGCFKVGICGSRVVKGCLNVVQWWFKGGSRVF